MNVIVDSCVFISFYDSDDSNHQKAISDLDKITSDGGTIWITEHILDEIVNILLKRNHKKQLRDFIKLIDKSLINIYVPKTQSLAMELIADTTKLVISQKKKKASYTDLYSMQIVDRKLLANVESLSYDHHFNRV